MRGREDAMTKTSDVTSDRSERGAVAPRPIRRLLCAIDLSETSAGALNAAAALARATGAEIAALFVFPPVPAYGHGEAPLVPDPGVRSVVAKDVESFVHGARAGGVSVSARVEVGDPAEEILAAATETKADAVVLGTHGRSTIERWMMGSVAQKVLRGAACPVLTVAAPRATQAAPHGILAGPVLCALDPAEASPATLRWALAIARSTGARVTALHVVEDPWLYASVCLGMQEGAALRLRVEEDAGLRLRRAIESERRSGDRVVTLVAAGKPYREILRVAQEENVAMIVMGREAADAERGALFGSNADRVMRAATCPVLTVRS
jgi:nucleotide-binding universal stress UspA family protein